MRKISYLLAVVCLFIGQIVEGQTWIGNKYKDQVFTNSTVSGISLTLPNISLQNNVQKAVIKVEFNLGDIYELGNLPFTGDVEFSLELEDPNGAVVSNAFKQDRYSLSINENEPQSTLGIDLTEKLQAISNVEGYNISVRFISFDMDANNSDVLTYINSNKRLKLKYIAEYGLNSTNSTATPLSFEGNNQRLKNRVVSLKWNGNSKENPNYEVQVLRLYNTNPTKEKVDNITTTVDWNKALKFYTESTAENIELTVPQGTGFYAWRVRPIGTYFEGGMGNSKNFGSWASSQAYQGATVSIYLTEGNNVIQGTTTPNNFFFLTDPNDTINWIYSRTFSEGNKQSESISYANGLQQTVQGQAYIASNGKTIVSQTVNDYMGRPTITTLPVPVSGDLGGGFKHGFVTNENGEIYSAKDFDSDGNLSNPDPMDQTNVQGLGYYSEANNTESNIPSAQGFPFSQTRYLNDGSGRLMETSGPGLAYSIGANVDGRGHTVKNYYGAVSEDELVRVFGDEAPNHESVTKNIVIDQNNIATVTYINKEGQTIATCMSIQDSDLGNLEELDNYTPTSFSINDVANKSLLINGAYVSSKRVVLLEAESNFSVSYELSCNDLDMPCVGGEVDCGLEVSVKIHHIESGQVTELLAGNSISLAPIACENGIKTVDFGTQALSPGTYIIEKRLSVNEDSISVNVSTSTEKVNQTVTPLIEWFEGKLKAIQCPADIDNYYADVEILAGLFNEMWDAESAEKLTKISAIESYLGVSNYIDTNHNVVIGYDPTSDAVVPKPIKAVISSGCCPQITIPIEYIPSFQCPTSWDWNDSKTYVSNTNMLNDPEGTLLPGDQYSIDFEGYAISVLETCFRTESIDRQARVNYAKGFLYANQDSLYTEYANDVNVPTDERMEADQAAMAGWKEGDLNRMVYYMITDQYQSKNAHNLEGEKEPELAGDYQAKLCDPEYTGNMKNPYINECSGDNCTKYTCDELTQCWTTQVFRLRRLLMDGAYELKDGDVVVSDETKTREEDGEESYNSTFTGDFSYWEYVLLCGHWEWWRDPPSDCIFKKANKHENIDLAEDLPANSKIPDFHMIEQFLTCSGYQFAGIVKEDSEGIDYSEIENNSIYGSNNPLVDDFDGGKGYAYSKRQDAEWSGLDRVKDLFPYTQDPVYAWKYYHYAPKNIKDIATENPYTSILTLPLPDGSQILLPENYDFSTNFNLEYSNCFVNPNVCTNELGEEIPCCVDENNDLRPCNFCALDQPYINCEFTHESWSAGERESFYLQLTKYETPTAEEWGATIKAYYPDEAIVPECDEAMTVSQFKADHLTSLKNMISECEEACMTDIRLSVFRDSIKSALFERNCYTQDGCRTADDATSHIIPEEDLDAIVNRIAEQCTQQCQINTVSCSDAPCRSIYNRKASWGSTPYVQDEEVNVHPVDITFGAGGSSSDITQETLTFTDGGKDYNILYIKTEEVPKPSHWDLREWEQAQSWNPYLEFPNACDPAIEQKLAEVDAAQPGDMLEYSDRTYQPIDMQNLPDTKDVQSGKMEFKIDNEGTDISE